MSNTRESFNKLLQAVWSDLVGFDWTQYATNYISHDEACRQKYTGIISLCSDQDGEEIYILGDLPNPEKSQTVVQRKRQMLQENQECIASMQVRNPSVGDWGGAVCSSNRSCIRAVSGLPEIGDHLLETHMMFVAGELPNRDWSVMTDLEFQGLMNALSDAGMTESQFDELDEALYSIVLHQHNKLS